ncbi:MAG TPA: hypothetical protein VH114_11105 [Candidatus Acidoferrum sp.]|jgi:hypothetical protein|nr:hypothetical protein [Candidatus Acidoferrum sp.]
MSKKVDWKAITPKNLVGPVEHIRNTFDMGVWKCSEVTEKLCFADLHPDDEHFNLAPYKSAFISYRKIIGLGAVQQFDKDHQAGTPPAIFHAYIKAFSAGIYSEIRRLFNELLQIGIANSTVLEEHPAEWAKTQLSLLINSKRHVVKTWIKSVCDKQDYSKAAKNDEEIEELIYWKKWRAPKLIYMQPSGNLRYDPSTAWNHEDETMTQELLDGLSDRFIQISRIRSGRTRWRCACRACKDTWTSRYSDKGR